VCGSFVKRLNVLATPNAENMVSVSSVPDLTGEWTSPARVTSVPSNGEYKSRSSPAVSVVRGPLVLWAGGPDPETGKKEEKLCG